MRKLATLFIAMASLLCMAGCDDDAWTTDPALEHIYYVGFYKTGTFSDELNYEIAADGTARFRINSKKETPWTVTGTGSITGDIPFELHSQFKYTYDIVSYFFVTNADASSTLVAGVDYQVIDTSGNALNPSDGKYAFTWSQAQKEGKKIIRIKRLTGATGTLKINTLDPAKGTPSTTEDKYVESTTNNIGNEYELRGLTHDFNKVTVTFR